MLPFIADLHVHSHYSRATSRDATPENYYRWALYKGVTLVGSGDFTHPAWREELKNKLEPAEEGLYRLKEEFCRLVEEEAAAAGHPVVRFEDPIIDENGRPLVRFIITGEISCIYKKGGRTRKVHHLILLPNLEAAEALSRRLEALGGNLQADGRPILGLDSRHLLEVTLEVCPEAVFIPAHIWTPHFSLFGANSGFDGIEECFADLSGHIYAVETGLSSDPPMNWRLSALDHLTLVSNSDAHSPRHLAREANIFTTELSYPAVRRALQERKGNGFLGTLEFFPEEGKYHYDGHRACGVCWAPAQTRAAEGVCPSCGRKVTVGVLHRVEVLADRPEGFRPRDARPYESLVPLPELLASALGVGAASKKVTSLYFDLLRRLGPELMILRRAPLEAVAGAAGPLVAEAVRRMRAGEVERRPGYDGEYGKIILMRPEEREYFNGQAVLFGEAGKNAAAAADGACREGADTTGNKVLAAVEEGKAPVYPAPAPVSGSKEGLPVALSAQPGSLLDGLNEEQRQAVAASGGPVIVLAGPGTGKTRTLVHRLAYLIGVRGVAPGRITAVTFTNKAAAEIRQRVSELLSGYGAAADLTIGTFHGICLDLLRKLLGIPQTPTVLDEIDAGSVLAEVLREMADGPSRQVLRVQRQISLLKSRGLLPASPGVPEDLRPVYKAYQERLAQYGVLDYDDILLRTLDCLEDWKVKNLLDRFDHLLVDEFQDVNPVQYRLVKLWAGSGSNLFVIGDPDQAIYGFRGASNRFFRKLQEDFPTARVFRLTRNYRSTPAILRAAGALIAHNYKTGGGISAETLKFVPQDAGDEGITPEPRALLAVRGDGPPVVHLEVPGETAAGIAIVREIGRLVGGVTMLQAHERKRKVGAAVPADGEGEGFGLADIAVLARTGRQLESLEECFLQEGIPYRLIARESFLEDRAVREVLAFCRCLVAPEDDFHVYRCLSSGLFGKGKRTITLVREASGRWHCTAWQAVERLTAGEGNGADLKVLQAFKKAVTTWRGAMELEPPARLLARWMEDYIPRKTTALDRLLRLAERFNDLGSFLQGIILAEEGDHERWSSNAAQEAVSLMTIHAAKGLEFPVVFIAGVEDGLLPLKERCGAPSEGKDLCGVLPTAGEAALGGEDALAEERRLFYVGLTRARERLILVSSRSRTVAGRKTPSRPSPFLEEIPADCLEMQSWTGKKRSNKEVEAYKQLTLF
ncbi:UvrD-helicase domain-containing protein [Neomoorella humiferrea]|uniref:DNA 3'-5' helicase n=1 Tax=Neomoorella humiferrea TaxID=676965 RepID=A0A2T0AYZ7_9FIRM|nr:UvrD-helicase domain-containing protein [Moorella humiferrea]PRR76239.1 ATP-dependent DNA helicase PcrA [Moorella humiferrea]